MPTYDFICNACQQRFDVFMTFSEYGTKPAQCTHCGSEDVRRRMTKVRIAKSDDSRMESMANGITSLDALENDPRALGKMMRQMGNEMGEDLPSEFDDVVDRLESGQSPEEIESALPDLDAEKSEDE
jgi:putative FmdB family regulatory protein